MACGAGHLPLAIVSWLLPAFVFGPALALAYFYFAGLMYVAVRTVFGTEDRPAVAIVCLSWVPLAAAVFLRGPLRFLLGWIASPFFLFYAYYYLGSEARALGGGLRSRQSFRRMIEAAAVNPHDAEAQYQLGLIYQQRHQYTEAIQRFKTAVAINPAETDAHFPFGRIARDQFPLKDALAHFQTVLDQDEKHSQSEILRELGAVYVSAHQYEDALSELSRYAERRPYDPEGLFYYGQALEGLNKVAEAREMYERAAEAARASPPFRRRLTAKWSRLAQKQLRRLPV